MLKDRKVVEEVGVCSSGGEGGGRAYSSPAGSWTLFRKSRLVGTRRGFREGVNNFLEKQGAKEMLEQFARNKLASFRKWFEI